ncbi:MAG: NAD(P)/FAD-dependent oxidoreductase [Dehalococcoidia bacterium]|nr:NAD(P)/FAD-dependent oxidoreductase [Dehalococcoidia bacterium]
MNDVIVIGAGPAGNNTAYRLASLGHDVLVADWRQNVGDKLCTGIVGTECIDRYPPHPDLIYKSVRSARLVTPDGRTSELSVGGVQAHIIDRVGYVASMAEKAKDAGAAYLLGSRATEVTVKEDRCQVRFTTGSGQWTGEAKAVVLASGFGSELSFKAGLGRPDDYVGAAQAEVEAPEIDRISIYVGRSVAPGFFAWLVPTSNGRALVGLLARHRAMEHLDGLIAQLKSEGKIADVLRGPSKWGIPLKPPSRTYGHRILAVGDVAGQVKPTTGGGIYYALLSSDAASDCLEDAFKRNDFSTGSLSTYERKWKSLLSKELKVGSLARRFFESLDDNQISYLANAVVANGLSSHLGGSLMPSFDWHSRAITKALSYPPLSKALTLVSPVLAGVVPHAANASPTRRD